MKLKIIALILTGLLSTHVSAQKPEWTGKGKPTKEQLAAHKAAMKDKVGEKRDDLEKEVADGRNKAKENSDQHAAKGKDKLNQKKNQVADKQSELKDAAEKVKKDKSDKLKGIDKQQQKKSQQVQNDLDKGSEKAIDAKQANKKKWWKFWE